jgi:hypothetical protein
MYGKSLMSTSPDPGQHCRTADRAAATGIAFVSLAALCDLLLQRTLIAESRTLPKWAGGSDQSKFTCRIEQVR